MLQNSGLHEITADSLKFTSRVKIMMFAKDNFIIEPSVFKGCISLEVLKFEEIDFTHTDPNIFEGLDELKILSLKNCKFNSSNFEFLDKVDGLTEFYLTDSKIEVPPLKAIQNMPLLKILDLSGNKLTYLRNDLIVNKHFLELLDLTNNEINEIQRNILEFWPNNAALNLEGNKCIHRNFGHLGTAELPLFDIVVHFMECFHHYDEEHENKKSSESNEASPETTEKSSEESTEKSDEKSDENEKQVIGIGSVSVEKSSSEEEDEEPISKEFDDISAETDFKKDKDEESVGFGSPYEFTNKTSSSSSEEEDEDVSDESTTTEEATTSTTTPTTTTTTTIEETTTNIPDFEMVTKKKKKKSKKKGIVEKEEESPIEKEEEEEEETTTNLPEETTTSFVEEKKAEEVTTPPNYLHHYEQASCRMFIDADKGYNCVLENVTPDLRHINVEHLSGHSNENVTGLFLRHSTLIKIPHVFFTTFENLVHLSIEETNLKQLDDDTLKEGCGKLKILNLKKNKIRVVESESLKTCIALEFIDLTSNPVERIEGGIFECNPNLNIQLGPLKITAAHKQHTAEKDSTPVNTNSLKEKPTSSYWNNFF